MKQDFVIVADDSGAVEIIRKSDLIKVYMIMPGANTVAFCWRDRMTGNIRTWNFTPYPLSEREHGNATGYFQSLIGILCDNKETKRLLTKELTNTRVKSYNNYTTEDEQ